MPCVTRAPLELPPWSTQAKAVIILRYYNCICLQQQCHPIISDQSAINTTCLLGWPEMLTIYEKKKLWVWICRPCVKSSHLRWSLACSARESIASNVIYKVQFLFLPNHHAHKWMPRLVTWNSAKKKKCKCVVHNNTSQQTVGYFLSEPQFLLRFDMSKDATWL